MSQPFPPQPPLPAPMAPPSPVPAAQSTGKMVAIVAACVAAALGLAGGIFALTRSDNPDSVSSPTASTEVAETTDVPATDVPATDVPASDVPATEPPASDGSVTDPPVTATPTSAPGETVPVDSTDGLTTIGSLLVWTSFSEEPLDEAAQQAEIDLRIAERTLQAVAHPTKVSTLCAGIPVDVPLDFNIVWQYQGETVQSDERRGAAPPGVGSCLSNDGEPLLAGAYQVLAADADLNEIGYATTFVVGATPVSQRFVNNTDIDLCQIAVAPLTTAYYEFFVSDGGAIRPGEFVDIDIASVEQDLRAGDCDGNDLEPLTFVPDASSEQNLTP